MSTRDEQEKEMLLLLNKMAPLAQQMADIDSIPKKLQEKAISGDKKELAQLRLAYASEVRRKQNLATELQPYQYQYNSYKYKYIQKYGTIDYNEFIKRNNLYWGLGIYW
jgi:hypothetical protein